MPIKVVAAIYMFSSNRSLPVNWTSLSIVHKIENAGCITGWVGIRDGYIITYLT